MKSSFGSSWRRGFLAAAAASSGVGGSHANAAAIAQLGLDQLLHLLVREPVSPAELEKRFFLLRRSVPSFRAKVEILVKLRDRFLLGLRGQLFVQLLATLGIEQFNARFGQETRRFVEAGTQQLRQRIARLIFQRQLFLPPEQQFAEVLLDQFVARIGPRIEAEPLVRDRANYSGSSRPTCADHPATGSGKLIPA